MLLFATLPLAGRAAASHAAIPLSGGAADRQGDRGFRLAERVLAAAVDIRGPQRKYLRRVAGPPHSESCRATRRCTYERHFDISVGARSKVALLFLLDLSDVGDVTCDRAPDNGCDISASVYLAGNEAFPHCIGVDRLHREAALRGWLNHPYRHPADRNVSRYRHADDNNTFMFIRTLDDNRCFHSIYIARIPLVEDSVRN
jgi:hypothetical protein